jgi:hypothetical protein
VYLTRHVCNGHGSAANPGVNCKFGYCLRRTLDDVNGGWLHGGDADLVDECQHHVNYRHARCDNNVLGHVYKFGGLFGNRRHNGNGTADAYLHQPANGYVGYLRRCDGNQFGPD